MLQSGDPRGTHIIGKAVHGSPRKIQVDSMKRVSQVGREIGSQVEDGDAARLEGLWSDQPAVGIEIEVAALLQLERDEKGIFLNLWSEKMPSLAFSCPGLSRMAP